MNDPIAAWHADHVNFGQLLGLLEKQVAVLHGGERPDYELMLDIMSYLRHYPDRFHHPREDAAFARLVAREAGLRPQVERLTQEHRVLATAGDALLARLNEAIDGQVVTREAIEAAAATYLVYYRAHLAAEERDIVPRAAALLTRADWDAITAAAPPGRDPLFGDEAEERYRALRRQIALGTRAG